MSSAVREILYNMIFPLLKDYVSFVSVWKVFNMIVEQGGIDEGEDPRNAAMRELKEETGVASAEVLAEVWMCNF